MMTWFRKSRQVVLLFYLVTPLGCLAGTNEYPVGTVSGKVTIQGKPLADYVIIFSNSEFGIGASAQLDETGMYHLDAPIRVGEYQVAVTSPPLPPPEEMARTPSTARSPHPARLPAGLETPETSGLIAVIEKGENLKNFQLP